MTPPDSGCIPSGPPTDDIVGVRPDAAVERMSCISVSRNSGNEIILFLDSTYLAGENVQKH